MPQVLAPSASHNLLFLKPNSVCARAHASLCRSACVRECVYVYVCDSFDVRACVLLLWALLRAAAKRTQHTVSTGVL